MSLRDVLFFVSDAINILIQSLLDRLFWLWLSAFAVAFASEYIFNCIQIQIFKKRDSELNRINLLKEKKK